MKKNRGSARAKEIGPTRCGPERFRGAWRRKVRPAASFSKSMGLEFAAQRYANLYEFAPIGYVSFDRSGRIAEINLTAARLFGMPREYLTGMPFAVLVCQQDIPLFLQHLLRCRSSDARVDTELRLKNAKREIIHAQLSSMPVTASPYNGAVLFQTCIVDLTARKATEAALQQKEAELELIITRTPFMLTRCTRDLRYRYVSRAYAEFIGRSAEEIAGKPMAEILGRQRLMKILPYIEKVLKGHNVEYERKSSSACGGPVYLHCAYTPDRDRNGKVVGWFASITDVTQRRKAEAALKRSKELLEKLVQQRTKALRAANAELQNEIARRKGLEEEILAVSDREQQRLGQELHDGLCQHLTAVAFMARSMAVRLRNHRVIDAADIEKVAELVNNAAADMRDLSRALHRSDVDAASLVRALHDLVDREIWKIPCRLEVKRSFHVEDDAVAAQLYRIAREAVINANKHAQARQIVIKLERSRRGMVLRVVDDGVGLTDKAKFKQGLGHHIMKYRAQLMGGHLEIDSSKRGTCVACYLSNGSGNFAKTPRSHRTDVSHAFSK